MKATNVTTMFLLLLTLSGCGKTIDTKNSDILYESLSEVMKDKTEIEKKEIAQDIALILRNRQLGSEEIYPAVMYDEDSYQLFIPGYFGKQDQLDLYREILLEAPELLTDKSSSDLKQDADDIRRIAWSRFLQGGIELASTLDDKRAGIVKTLGEHQTKFTSMNDKLVTLENMKNNFPITLLINEIKAESAPFFKTSGTVRASVFNTLEKDISKVSAEVHLWMKNEPEKKKRFLLDFKLDNTISKDQESLSQPIGLNFGRMRNATNNINDWDSSVDVRKVFFAGESKGYDFTPDKFSKYDVRTAERAVEACQRVLDDLDEYMEKSPRYISELKEMVKQPKNARVAGPPTVDWTNCQ